jgi:glutamate-ammonia-ligase adenylyltransferase
VLLDPQFFGTLPDKDALKELLNASLAGVEAYEEFLDRLRIFGQEQRFLISVRVLTGSMSPYDAGVSYSRLADVLIRRTLAEVRRMFETRHGRPPGGEIAVLALGKLGGREMTARSDLDLIVLYDHDADASQSDGEKPLAPSQYFIRLTQRLVAALSAPTAQGSLYEVDFRLRPSGNAGPLATRLSSFETYQRGDAWTWEHMALTRARSVAGDAALVARANAIIRSVLCLPRERERLYADIRDMRARLEREKPGTSPWQIKLAPGGLIDLEFIAQALQLAHAAETPAILAGNTRRVFDAALHEDYIGAADHELLSHAATLYQSLTQILTLALEGDFDPRRAPAGLRRLLRRAGDAPDFDHLEADRTQTEHSVRRRFEKLLDGAPESAASSARGGQ